MTTTVCRHCCEPIRPDGPYLFPSNQDGNRWIHWNYTYVCFPERADSPYAQPPTQPENTTP